MLIYALHGFLGKPSDWKDAFKVHDALDFECIDLMKDFPPEKDAGFWGWARRFNQEIEQDKRFPKILLGYSLGGRLALHALLENPSLWQGAVLISMHPGLISQQAKSKRLFQDQLWKERFEKMPWDSLMNLWGRQKVFGGKTFLKREEKDYDRRSLGLVFEHWSLGRQDDLTEKLEALNLPILWMAGENDRIYRVLSSRLLLAHQSSRIWIAPKSFHRVPWETPYEFSKQVASFTGSLL